MRILPINVANIIDKLKDIFEYKEYNAQNSRYLDNESRRNIYKTWLNSEALAICEAAARYPEEVEESERFEATKQAAEQWNKEHHGQKKNTHCRR